MARSTPLFILLATLVIQVVLACSGITPGVYVIENKDAFLTPGPIPAIYPPIDVQARVLPTPAFGFRWLIEAGEGGYTITEFKEHPSRFQYTLVKKNGEPYLSVDKEAYKWAVNAAGDGLFTIGLSNEDRLLTADHDEGYATLQRADGGHEQKWSLHRLDRDRNLYSNRFQHIL